LVGAAQNIVLDGSQDPENVIKNELNSSTCSAFGEDATTYDELPVW
jgi:hypothetical protein